MLRDQKPPMIPEHNITDEVSQRIHKMYLSPCKRKTENMAFSKPLHLQLKQLMSNVLIGCRSSFLLMMGIGGSSGSNCGFR